MNEQDVRALVREAIERHLGRPSAGKGREDDGQGEGHDRRADHDERRAIDLRSTHSVTPHPSPLAPHPSHVFLHVLPGSDVDDGMCVIEPRVRCNHCGFCQSYGH